MIQSWVTILVAIVYVSMLFAVASFGDSKIYTRQQSKISKPNIYALSLAVYCTTWTYFGSVGLASVSGLSFLAIYLGPVIAITLGYPLIKRVIRLSKEERITSVADFLGSRYGKNLKVAAVAASIAVIGTVPYIALQLKAISGSVDTLLIRFENGYPSGATPFGDITIFVAAVLALFAILFGTRHADATENQHGLMLAIALESVLKLAAFLCVGIFVTFFLFDGFGDLFSQAATNNQVQKIVSNGFDVGNFLILTFLSFTVFLLLPRQFHVAVVENNSEQELARARWLFPLYLVAINLFVIPIALAGILKFGQTANADDYVLLLPMLESQLILGLFAFIGGLSAGTAMVIVACVALAIMISNDLVLPLMLRVGSTSPANMERRILNIRRTSIFVVMLLAYIYYALADNTAALASIGLISFAAIAQLAPAFFGGLVWKHANARGAMFGMITGFCVWAYTLLLPTLLPASTDFIANGLFGLAFLKPQALFGLDTTPVANGVIWSILFNTCAFVLASYTRKTDPQERMQAEIFVSYQLSVNRQSDIGKSKLNVSELTMTISRYLGSKRTNRSFDLYWQGKATRLSDDDIVDNDLLFYSEQLLASAIGASSSRLVHTLLIKQHEFNSNKDSNIELLDQASKALQFNRDVLQTALDQLEQGITVFDGDFRLTSWNTQFRKLLNLPSKVGQAGTLLSDIAKEIAIANELDEIDPNGEDLSLRLLNDTKSWHLHLPEVKEILEISKSPMPEGGLVITWNNITERVQFAEALKEANERLEVRVEERTRELEEAKQFADQANASKTRFLAAAGHDILQPLNAARLYSATLHERLEHERTGQLAENIGRSLGSVEEILGSILAISRLDTANPEVNLKRFPLRNITEQLELEFEPIAKEEGLELKFIHSSIWVYSDQALLRRLLQNLISNALKFTITGKVLVGCRRNGETLNLEVLDTGIGMNEDQQKLIFAEFTRLNEMSEKAPGLGLGLSIVDRIATLLNHDVKLNSAVGKGTHFQVALNRVEAEAKEVKQLKSVKKRKLGQLTGTRILCIDNDVEILNGMTELLEQWGCSVDIATDLPTAIHVINKNDQIPDIILADYHLQNATGINAYESIQAHYSLQLPGILITADRTEEMKHEASQAGMFVLNKPLKPAALRALISQQKRSRIAAE